MMYAANRFFPDARFFKDGDNVQKTAFNLLKPKEGHIYRAVDNAADATRNYKSFSNKTNWYEGEGFLIEAKKEQEGITVPPEYGSIEIEQVKTKEGERIP